MDSMMEGRKEKAPDTKKMLALLEESRSAGSETAVKMSEQTEQMHRIRGSTEKISSDLDTSAHFMRKLGMRRRLNKAIKTFTRLGGPPPPPKEVLEAEKIEKMKHKIVEANSTVQEPYEPHEVKSSVAEIRLRTKNRGARWAAASATQNSQGSMLPEDGAPGSPPSNPFESPSSAEKLMASATPYVPDIDPTTPEGMLIREQDDDLDRMSDLLGELKEIAIQQGKETETQSVLLDEIGDNVDKANIRTAANTKAMTMKYGIKRR